MPFNLNARRVLAASAAAGAVGGAIASVVPAVGATRAPYSVVANNLNNPRALNFGPDGSLYIAEAGRGGNGACATAPESGSKACVGLTGSIFRVKGRSHRRVVGGLPSVAGANGQDASGPSDVIFNNRRLVIAMQDTNVDQHGNNPFGTPGRLLGNLVQQRLGTGKQQVGPNFAKYEAAHNPDHGAGASPDETIDSDPYSVAAYRGGYVVADAAGNDLLQVDRHGKIRVLAVFPIQMETAPPGVAGPMATTLPVQSVPTSVVVGPDHALYVGELTGFPFGVGAARIWRVVPGHKATVYAKGFTNISSLAFDRKGRLLVLEIDKAGLLDEGNTSGELIRLDRQKHRKVLLADALTAATGVAVARNGSIYVSIFGIFPGTGPGPHGKVVRLNVR